MNSAQIDLMNLAWQDYTRALRQGWVRAPHVERTYFRSQDWESYSRARRTLVMRANGAVAAWHASVRRIAGRTATVDAVGTANAAGMPVCFLVRVPKSDRLIGDEYLYGTPSAHDEEGREYVGSLLVARRKEKQEQAGRARVVYLDGKLRESLVRLRAAQAAHGELKPRLAMYSRFRPERPELEREQGSNRARIRRAHEAVHRWRGKLAKLGIQRDIALL